MKESEFVHDPPMELFHLIKTFNVELENLLFWNNFRFTDKLQKYKEFLYTLHPAYSNVNITGSICQEIGIGRILQTTD